MNLKLKYVAKTLNKLADPGVFLVGSKKDGSSNVMAIGWGLVGNFWTKPVFLVAVRHSRFTHEFIEDSGEFTVNVQVKGLMKLSVIVAKLAAGNMTNSQSANLLS